MSLTEVASEQLKGDNTSTVATADTPTSVMEEVGISKRHSAKRRSSSVYILQTTGTSLTRHKNPTTMSVDGSLGATLPATPTTTTGSDVDVSKSAALPKSSLGLLFNSKGDSVPASPEDDDIEKDLHVPESRKPFQDVLSDSLSTPVDDKVETSQDEDCLAETDADGKTAPFFEHFLVVGMPQEVSYYTLTVYALLYYSAHFIFIHRRQINSPHRSRLQRKRQFLIL